MSLCQTIGYRGEWSPLRTGGSSNVDIAGGDSVITEAPPPHKLGITQEGSIYTSTSHQTQSQTAMKMDGKRSGGWCGC